MFNVLISAYSKAWETDQFMRMEKTRFGEYSGKEIEAISLDDPHSLKLLEQVESLLLYETGVKGENARVVRLGHVHDVSIDGRDIRFQFAETGRLAREVVEEFAYHLSLHDWELNRTHWAVKDGDIPTNVLGKVCRTFDVFLCHNSRDKSKVIELGNKLKGRGLSVWLDEWEIPPGSRWQDSLEEIIANCGSAVVCVAGNGLPPLLVQPQGRT